MNTPAPLPQWPAAPKRSRIRGRIWKTAGVISLSMILLWPVVFSVLGWIEPGDTQTVDALFELFMFVFGIVGVKCFLRGKRHMAIAATELLAKDTRPPVIYLRSFQHDKAGSGSATGSRFWGTWSALFDLKTVEERLAEALTPIGPVVAIGKPGEKLPALGAARLYVGDDEWQDTIQTLMARAKLVVLLLGDTPGFWWELERSVKDLPPERLVLIVPFKKKRYEAFRERAAAHFPHPLPEYDSKVGFASFRFRPRRGLGKLVGLVYFRKDWTSAYVDLTRIKPSGYRKHYLGRQRLEKSLSWNLRPVFERLGLVWTPPKVRRGYVALLATATGIIILSAAGFVSLMIPQWRENAARKNVREAFVTKVQEAPAVRATFGALEEDAAAARAGELARHGILRLDDASVIERQRIIGELWLNSSQACIGPLMDGTEPLPESGLQYQSLPLVETWYRILADAAIAEANETPPASAPSKPEITAAFEHYWPRYADQTPNTVLFIVRERTKAEGVREFLTALPLYEPFGFVQVYEANVCRAFGELNLKAGTLPAPHNAILARALAAALR